MKFSRNVVDGKCSIASFGLAEVLYSAGGGVLGGFQAVKACELQVKP